MRAVRIFIIFLTLAGLCGAQAQTSPQVVSLQGRILDPASLPLESASVQFTIEVISPGAEECLLFQETHTLNMTGSGGVFSLNVGIGSRAGVGFEDVSTLAQVFNNASGALSSLTCTVGTTYTPAATAKRKIKMTFDDGGGPQVVTQLLDLQSVPFALYADTLQGRGPANFVQTSAQTTQVKIDALAIDAAYTELMALINGTTAQYTKVNGSNFVPSAAVDFNNQRLTNLAAPTLASDAVNKTYSDAKFGGSNLDLAGLANGQSVRWNSVGTKWEVYTPSSLDSTKLPLAGGTMTGAIDMGGFNFLATGHITMSPQKTINLGTYTNAQETTLATALAAIDEGKTWFNSDSNQIKFWTGAAVAVSGNAVVGSAGTEVTSNANIPNCLANQKLQMSAGPVYAFTCVVDDAGQWVTSGANIYFNTGDVGIGTTSPNTLLDINGAFSQRGMAVPAVSPAGQGRVYFDSTSSKFRASENGGAYVDIISGGLSTYQVQVATTANIALTGTQTIDGVAVVNGSRVLVKNQTSTQENGVYVVAAGAWTRATDMDTWTETISYTVKVSEGTSWAGMTFSSSTTVGGTIDTNSIIWNAAGSGSVASLNTVFGTNALNANTTGTGNTANGVSSLNANTTGIDNTAYGIYSLILNTTGSHNTTSGRSTLNSNTTGNYNSAYGRSSMSGNTTGSNNTAYGRSSLFSNSAKNESTAVGYNSMTYADSTTTSAISYNTAIGAYSLRGSLTASNNVGTRNTAVGHSALVGMTSGSSNIGFGYSAGSAVTTGSNNVIIGSNTGASIATSSDNILVSDGDGTERMRVDSAGNVGIGTTTPTIGTRLDITGTGAAESSIIIPRDTTGNRPTVGVDGMMRYNTSNGKFEIYEAGAWTNMVGGTSSSVSAGNGTVGAPSMSFSGDTNTGFYSNGADTVGIAAGGANVFNISSTSLSSPTTGGALITSGNGTAAAPTFSFAGDPDTGWWRPAADTMAASTAGAERMRIDSTGNVGIGTTPTSKLHVVGDVRVDGGNLVFGGSTASIFNSGTGAGSNLLLQGGGSADGYLILRSTGAVGTSDSIRFQVGNSGATEAMRIISSGNVGVGTTVPNAKLAITAADYNAISLANSNTNATDKGAVITGSRKTNANLPFSGFGTWDNGVTREVDIGGGGWNRPDATVISFFTASAYNETDGSLVNERMRINSSGNVGIGVTTFGTYWGTTPTLEVKRGSGSTLINVDSVAGGDSAISFSGAGSAKWALSSRNNADTPNDRLSLYDSSSERLTVLQGGNVGIGTTAPTSSLDVSSTAGAVQTLSRNDTDVADNDTIGKIQFWNNDTQLTTQQIYGNIEVRAAQNITTNAAASEMIFRTTGTTAGGAPVERMRIDGAGNIGIGANSPAYPLEVTDTAGTGAEIGVTSYGINAADVGSFAGRAARGTMASPTALQTNDRIISFRAQGYDGAWVAGASAAIEMDAAEVWTSSAHGTYMKFETTNIGSGSRTEKVRITDAGNVGIGTTAPGYLLDVSGNSGSDTGIRAINTNNAAAANTLVMLANDVGNYGGLHLRSSTHATDPNALTVFAPSVNTSLIFQTNGAEKMRILSGGNVGIGTTAPTAALDVTGHIASSGTAPTVGTCGTSPSITGTDTRGQVTFGTGAPTACTISFATAYTTTPYCMAMAYGSDTGGSYWIQSTSTTTLVINVSTGLSSQKFNYFCIQ